MKIAFHHVFLFLFILIAPSVQGQKNFRHDVGLSLNLMDIYQEGANSALNSQMPTQTKYRPGWGFHYRFITKSDRIFNASIGSGILLKRIKTESSGTNVIRNDFLINFPILLHIDINNRFRFQTGVSIERLLRRNVRLGQTINDLTHTANKGRLVPTIGLEYQISGSLELNLNYHLGIFSKEYFEQSIITGQSTTINNVFILNTSTALVEQYLQLSFFYTDF